MIGNKKDNNKDKDLEKSEDFKKECSCCEDGKSDYCKELEIKNAELTNQLQRALADYQNLQKRVVKEREDLHFISNISMLEKLLDVSDDFNLAIEKYTKTDADEASWLSGIKLVRDKMSNIFEDQFVKEIVCQIDDAFDPNFHEALSTMKVEDKEMDGKIIAVIRKGYLLGDRILRPARVVVGRFEN